MASLQLTLISGGTENQNHRFDFSNRGGTIGRSKECDWALEDPNRFISNKHISISLLDNRFVLTDTSSNGVFINNSQTPVGKGNTYALAQGDKIALGKFCIEVRSIDIQPALSANHAPSPVYANAPDTHSPQSSLAPQSEAEDSLGLFAILSGDVQSTPQQTTDYKSPHETKGADAFLNDELVSKELETSSHQFSVNTDLSKNTQSPSTIPEDWNFDASIVVPANKPSSEQKLPEIDRPLSEPKVDTSPVAPEPIITAHSKPVSASDNFFELLYEKLGLPKEQLHSVDQATFADDLAQVLLTSTQGIMGLLAGRSVFKTESRLSMTMIRPQSNNPIKFSIDPTDTLEMLLVKKKPGYMSAKDAYAEALNDLQLHQAAFLSGLQATLCGTVNELSPSNIEHEVSHKQKGFLGMKATTQKWQMFVDKQDALKKQVSENLNDILSRHFSEAYEKHIDSANHKE